MSRVRSKNTKPEVFARSVLHRMGYRFRVHRKDLPGNPDIVLPKHRAVIFVHGCFWHRHPDCSKATVPKTNADWWRNKLENNVERDARNYRQLRELGWRVFTLWECETKEGPEVCAERMYSFLRDGSETPHHCSGVG